MTLFMMMTITINHHSMINDQSSRSYSDCALVAVGDLQKPDGERCADTLCGGQALHNSHDDDDDDNDDDDDDYYY